jgi:hypothetical protein
MSELEECLGDVVRHVEGDGASGVVPVNVDAAEKQAVPVHGDCVVFLEWHLEMRDVIVRGVFYAKVVDNKAKHYVMPNVLPETGSVLALVISLCIEAFFEEFVGKYAGLREAIHAHPNFDVNPSLIIDEVK